MQNKNEPRPAERRKFDFKKFIKRLFTNNIVYKLSAIFLGFVLWLFLGYINSGL